MGGSSRFSFWSQVKCSTTLLIMESWRRSCQMRLCYGETSCFIPTPLKWDTTERCWTRSPSYAPNQTHTGRVRLLTAWSAQWFSPLVHFRVNFPPINVWFPGPYCVLLLPYHADEFSLSVSLRAKWKRAANFTPGEKRGKILGANHWLVVVTQCKPLGWNPARCLILFTVNARSRISRTRLKLFPWLGASLTPCDLWVSKESM